MERWLPVVGLEGFYEVSDLGRVRTVAHTVTFERQKTPGSPVSVVTRRVKARVRIPQSDGEGCHHFLMIGDVKRYVHRMVLEAFVGPCPDGQECRHADDDPPNNKLENLSWGTHADNMLDSYRNGRKSATTGPEHAIKAWATKRRRAAEAALNQPVEK